MCYLPQVGAIAKETWPPCKTLQEATSSRTKITTGVSKIFSEEVCKKPCRSEEYSFIHRVTPLDVDADYERTAIFAAYWDTTDVETRHEHVLYDLNSIIASIGGSMGLFLGFSCYQFIVWLVDKVEELLVRVNKKAKFRKKSNFKKKF